MQRIIIFENFSSRKKSKTAERREKKIKTKNVPNLKTNINDNYYDYKQTRFPFSSFGCGAFFVIFVFEDSRKSLKRPQSC